ncbi:protein of unknown function [Rhodovastum atsumiense]|nr:protein of unknown function [Rhodovastum atsumiense]
MDPDIVSLLPGCAGLPRPRGDGPNTEVEYRSLDEAPPPTRGWTPSACMIVGAAWGSPAHAGMDLPLN